MNALETSDRRLKLDLQAMQVGQVLGHGYFLDETVSSLRLEAVTFRGFGILNCRFDGGQWLGVKLERVDLACVHFRHLYFEEVDFSDCTFASVNFDSCVFSNCRFSPDAVGYEKSGCHQVRVASPADLGVPQGAPLVPPSSASIETPVPKPQRAHFKTGSTGSKDKAARMAQMFEMLVDPLDDAECRFPLSLSFDTLLPLLNSASERGTVSTKTLLILDDEILALEAIQIAMGGKYKLFLASSFQKAVQILENEEIDGAMMDINLQTADHDGVEFLSLFKKKYPEKPALVVSGYREVPTVVKCIKLGADDYLEKPFDRETLEMKIDKVFASSVKTRVYQRAFEKSAAELKIVGKDSGLVRAKQMISEAATLRVLLVGETGVGKTPFARYSSDVVSELTGQIRPFEQLNCACLNTEQFQDQLFGHKKGAFTGAITDKRGLVELARGGDLFLDEIGEMPLETQAMFLTFLDSMEYYRLGDDVKRKADVRIISATNRNLKKMVEEGKFRKDLYSRISQVVVNIPALRDRQGDIPLLLEHFIEKFAGFPKPYNPEVLTLLREQRWEEGNVRELQDTVEFLCLRSRGSETIEVEHVPPTYRSPMEESEEVEEIETSADDFRRVLDLGLESYLEAYERRILQRCLEQYQGTLDEMARHLKVSRPTLYRRLKRHRITTGTREESLH